MTGNGGSDCGGGEADNNMATFSLDAAVAAAAIGAAVAGAGDGLQ